MPLGGYLSDPAVDPAENDMLADRMPASTASVNRVLLSGGTPGSLTGLVVREGGRQLSAFEQNQGLRPRSPVLSAQDANRRFGIEGELVFQHPLSEEEAAWRYEAKRDELMRQDILNRNTSVGPLTAFATAMAGGFFDPITMPLNFIPGLGGGLILERFGLTAAAQTTRMAAISRGVLGGAVDGLAVGAVTEGATYGLAGLREGRDYGLEELAAGLTMNTLFGAGMAGLSEGFGHRAPFRSGSGLGAGNPIAAKIRERAAAMGEDPETAVNIAVIESGLDPNADNPASSAQGVYQFVDRTWKAMGGGDKFDADLNIERGLTLMAQNRNGLRQTLGRDPDAWELYLAHQQGLGGARQLLRDPNRPAIEALRAAKVADPEAAIRLNGGRADMTAGEFADLWRKRYNEKTGSTGGGVETPRTGQAPEEPDAPPAVNGLLDDQARAGAFVKALEDMAEDRPVSVGRLIDQELDAPPEPVPALDEAPGEISIPARLLDADTVSTVRGNEVPVRYALVEARDLITSHDDDLISSVEYPRELAPRERLVLPDAPGDAPVVSRDGVVEGGNAEAVFIRREAGAASKVYEAYRAKLEKQGFDLADMQQPVLVRIRTEPMDGGARVRLARELAVGAERRPAAAVAEGASDAPPASPAKAIYDAASAEWREPSAAPATAKRLKDNKAPKDADEEIATLEAQVSALDAELKSLHKAGAISDAELAAVQDPGGLPLDVELEGIKAGVFCLQVAGVVP